MSGQRGSRGRSDAGDLDLNATLIIRGDGWNALCWSEVENHC